MVPCVFCINGCHLLKLLKGRSMKHGFLMKNQPCIFKKGFCGSPSGLEKLPHKHYNWVKIISLELRKRKRHLLLTWLCCIFAGFLCSINLMDKISLPAYKLYNGWKPQSNRDKERESRHMWVCAPNLVWIEFFNVLLHQNEYFSK